MRGRIVKQPINDKIRMSVLFEADDTVRMAALASVAKGNDHYANGSEHSVPRKQFHCLQLLKYDDMTAFMCVADNGVRYRFSRSMEDRHPDNLGVEKDEVVKGIITMDGWIHTNTEFWLPMKLDGEIQFAMKDTTKKTTNKKGVEMPFWTTENKFKPLIA